VCAQPVREKNKRAAPLWTGSLQTRVYRKWCSECMMDNEGIIYLCLQQFRHVQKRIGPCANTATLSRVVRSGAGRQ
jgi:hypothetical protein